MAEPSDPPSEGHETTAGEQFRSLKERISAATSATGQRVRKATKATSAELERAIARWTPLPLSPDEIDRLKDLRESLPHAPSIPTLDELAQTKGKVMVPVEEYEGLVEAYRATEEMRKEQGDMLIESVAITQRLLETEKSLERLTIEASELEQRRERRPIHEQRLSELMGTSISESVTLLGFSVLWLAALIGATMYVEPQSLLVGDYSVDLFIWSIGTSIWSLVILYRLNTARTILAMPLGMRVQTSVGVGLVTAMALLLSKEEFAAIGTVWGWTATIALAALLLSGLMRGMLNSAKAILGFRGMKVVEPKGD
ncbi:MAG: hypothetical protein QF834_03220 [Candidatus Thalassarchaeaceae archaeon]|nr:hypothetical protein [Candidatus Thalassarchaeaceae archaeon]